MFFSFLNINTLQIKTKEGKIQINNLPMENSPKPLIIKLIINKISPIILNITNILIIIISFSSICSKKLPLLSLIRLGFFILLHTLRTAYIEHSQNIFDYRLDCTA